MSSWIKHLADQLDTKHPVTDLDQDVDDAFTACRSEYAKGNSLREKRLNAIWKIISSSVRHDSSLQVLNLEPAILELVSNAQNIAPIVEAFKPFERGKVKFYGMCLVYLMNVEGVFDQAMRIIHGLLSIAQGKRVIPDQLAEMKIRDIRTDFKKAGIPTDILFAGWENGHVRNSIAHCRFHYDDKTEKIRFRDLNPETGKKWSKDYSIEQFSQLFLNLDDAWHIPMNLIFMLRVLQLVLTDRTPRAGKDLIFKA